MSKFNDVIKRSGTIVPFNRNRIMNAIYRAAVSVGGRDKERAALLADKVITHLEKLYVENHLLNIEEIQDAVEKVLIENGHAQVTKEFILGMKEIEKGKRKQN